MKTVTLAHAKAHLSQLVECAAGGEPVAITRRGKPVARLTSATSPREPIDLSLLRALTASMPIQTEDAGSFVRAMRDSDRY